MNTSDSTSDQPSRNDPGPLLTWDAPGPGTWEFDTTHQSSPIGRFGQAVLLGAYSAGFAEGMAAVGSPLETIDVEVVNGWMYMRPKPLGEPEGGQGGPPPKFVLQVLFRIHPTLRRRLTTAKSVFEDRAWEQALRRWHDVERPAFRRRLDDIAGVEVETLDDVALTLHVETVARLITDSTHTHFAHAPWGALVLGDYLVRCEDAGISGPEAMRALTGASDPVRRPTELAAAVVDALREDDGVTAIEAPAAELFAAIRAAGPASAEALEAYLDEVGAWIVGESVADPTVAEQPGWVQSVLARCLEPATVEMTAEAARVADELAIRVPTAERPAWRRSLADARAIAPLRDADVQPLVESVGRARLALLEVGRRLVENGTATAPDDAFELRPEEVGATLAGRGVTATTLAGWVDERTRQALVEPPHALGPPSVPPPIDLFPAPIARVTRAVWAFISRFHAEGDELHGGGHGVSPGSVTGRAVLVRGLADLDRVEPGDIIVTRTTMPTFNTVLAMSGGVVTEFGGAICHAAIMSREFGIPGVVGYPDAMSIPDGATIQVDGSTGTVTVVSLSTPTSV